MNKSKFLGGQAIQIDFQPLDFSGFKTGAFVDRKLDKPLQLDPDKLKKAASSIKRPTRKAKS